MCGIAGWVGTVPDRERVAGNMALAMHRRGPDAQGTRSWPDAMLIHTRLSIIDLSPFGAQPMSNEDGTVCTVFNGEIYNHRELRRELESKGHRFRGRSDTEILPHLYEEEGSEFLGRLRGMFALAVYDTRNQTLLLARDRYGIKPLFYAPSSERIAFASEINALLTVPNLDLRPDPQAVHDFAALFYIPAPETFYRSIRSLEPGEMLEARLEQDDVVWKTRFYHRWSIELDSAITLAGATDRVEELLVSAVGSQMESDVPLGTLLSGGIDSSLVSDAAQSATAEGVRTFNVRFPDKEYDETWAAVAVAAHIGSHHQTLEMREAEGTWNEVTGLLQYAGQPFADTSIFAANAVCKLMRRNVTVALSGDGGDEAFGGYDLYRRLGTIAKLRRMPGPVWRGMWHGAAAALGPMARIRMASVHHSQRARDMVPADDTAVIQNLFCPVHQNEHRELCLDLDVLPVRRLFEQKWEIALPVSASPLERLSAHATEINIRLQLSNAFLSKVDTASMKESLEVRVPMLDEDLFAFGLSLPHALKVNGQKGKAVLRSLAKRRLPEKVAAKRKQGFAIPIDKWVGPGFRSRLKETLLGPESKLGDFFSPEAYTPIVESFCEGRSLPGIHRSGLYRRAIMLLSVHLSLSRNGSLYR
jgi:asparagine synthase (glutamine-hydrolysing)